MNDLPKEVLTKIAECLDLATQVNLWETNKHLCEMLNGEVQFVKDFDSTACSVPLDYRCNAEAFALCGIELLSNLPSSVQTDSHVEVVYTDMRNSVDTIDISYLDEQIIPGIPNASLFQVEYSQKDTHEVHLDDSDDSEDQDRLLFEDLCDKRGVHRLLCTAPDLNSIPEVRQIASRVILQSSGSLENLKQCAQFCFELMCSRRWYGSALYIAIPPPDPCHDVHDVGAVRVGRWIRAKKDVWSVDYIDTPAPVKLDFASFPQGASRVLAYFHVNVDCSVLSEPEYLIGKDLVRQQCMAFVYEAN